MRACVCVMCAHLYRSWVIVAESAPTRFTERSCTVSCTVTHALSLILSLHVQVQRSTVQCDPVTTAEKESGSQRCAKTCFRGKLLCRSKQFYFIAILQEFLVDWLRQNMSVVMETDPLQLTDLGMVRKVARQQSVIHPPPRVCVCVQLLWSHWESTLLELLTETVLSGQLTLEQLLSLVKVRVSAIVCWCAMCAGVPCVTCVCRYQGRASLTTHY